MSSSELVSVIIPIHNRFDLVDQTVDSVINQSYRPIELILVDDFSEHLYTVPEDFNERGIFIILKRLNKNVGPGGSRNEGLKLASGSFICYLDSDDLWAVNLVEKQVKMLKSNPNLGMCYCKTAIFDNPPITGQEKLRRRNNETFNTILPTLFYGRPWSTGSCMWTQEAVELIGPWIDAWTWEDVEYDFRAGLKGVKIGHLPEPLCYKRNNPEIPRLSNIPHKQAILQQFCSVIEMSKSLTALMATVDVGIREAFVYKVLRPIFINLIKLGEYEAAKVIINYMKIISNPLSRKWVLSNLLFILLHFRNNPVGYTFLHRVVNSIS